MERDTSQRDRSQQARDAHSEIQNLTSKERGKNYGKQRTERKV